MPVLEPVPVREAVPEAREASAAWVRWKEEPEAWVRMEESEVWAGCRRRGHPREVGRWVVSGHPGRPEVSAAN